DPIDVIAGLAMPGIRAGIGAAAGRLTESEIQGVSRSQLAKIKDLLRNVGADVGGDAFAHGSRVARTARRFSDLDIAIKVSPERFQELLLEHFGAPFAPFEASGGSGAELGKLLRAINT